MVRGAAGGLGRYNPWGLTPLREQVMGETDRGRRIVRPAIPGTREPPALHSRVPGKSYQDVWV